LGLGIDARIDDLAGFNVIGRNMQAVLRTIEPQYKEGISLTVASRDVATKVFLWPGVDWSSTVIVHRLLWFAVAAGVALLASLFFHRFDPARDIWSWKRSPKLAANLRMAETPSALTGGSTQISAGHLTAIECASGQARFLQLVVSELRLMLKGHRWWWYVAAAGLFVASLAAPSADAHQGVLVAAWLWPVLVWSQMGSREARYDTGSLIFSCQSSLSRQLPAVWVAGVLVALATGGGAGMRLLLNGDWHRVSAWLAGALFIPSLALALGVWSGSSKSFEALYTVWWYLGPANHTPGLDFMGTTPASSNAALYFSVAASLLAVSYWGRRVRLGYA
jgi:hypothetical protein